MGGCRGAFRVQRSQIVRTGGARGSANAGTSSAKHVRNVFAEMPEVSDATLLGVGSVGPKPRAKAVGDGQRVDSPVPRRVVLS